MRAILVAKTFSRGPVPDITSDGRVEVQRPNVNNVSILSTNSIGLIYLSMDTWVDGVVVTQQFVEIVGPWFKPKSIHFLIFFPYSTFTKGNLGLLSCYFINGLSRSIY